jgi:phage terminase small subunit
MAEPKKISRLHDTAPAHLSADSQARWRRIMAEFSITDEAGRLLLQKALENFELAQECREAIRKDGASVAGSRRQPRAHPLFAALHAAETRMFQAFKLLNLDWDPGESGRR